MKKLLITTIAALAAAACSPDVAQVDTKPAGYTIDKVECTAPSQFFAADGKDGLDLQVRIYSKSGTYTDNYGGTQTRYVEVPRDRWRNHDIKFFVNGAQVQVPYTTTTAGALKCYATVDGVRSSLSPAAWAALFPVADVDNPFTDPAPAAPADEADFVATAEAPVAMQARKIPVIFHIIDSDQNRQSGQILNASSVYAVIDKWNAAFADANIEFVPALKNATNAKLAEPGINRYYPASTAMPDYVANYQARVWNTYKYNDSKGAAKGDVVITTANFNYFRDNNLLAARYPDSYAFYAMARYLNVWVWCTEVNATSSTFANVAAEYLPTVFPDGVWNESDLPMPASTVANMRPLDTKNMGYWNTNPGDLRIVKVGETQPTFTNANANVKHGLRQAGLSFRKDDMANIGTAKSTEVVAAMGAFLGLVPNYPVYATESRPGGAWQDDFCSDTPPYSLWYTSPRYRGMEMAASGSTRVKYTCQPPYAVYTSDNVMEYGSSQTRLTPQQLARIEWTLNNAPGRAMWKTLTAITE